MNDEGIGDGPVIVTRAGTVIDILAALKVRRFLNLTI
jgi:hypothetical protein